MWLLRTPGVVCSHGARSSDHRITSTTGGGDRPVAWRAEPICDCPELWDSTTTDVGAQSGVGRPVFGGVVDPPHSPAGRDGERDGDARECAPGVADGGIQAKAGGARGCLIS